jgi:hypothetical protein
MKVYVAFEIVFVLAQKAILNEPDCPPEYKEALRIALDYYTSQLADYANPDKLPNTEIIRRRLAWRDLLIAKGIPVPHWLQIFPCTGCGTDIDIDKPVNGLCEKCQKFSNIQD